MWESQKLDDGRAHLYEPVLAAGKVYGHTPSSNDPALVVFNLKTGKDVWKVENLRKLFNALYDTIRAAPCIADGLVYYMTNNGVASFDMETGQKKWVMIRRHFHPKHGFVINNSALYYYDSLNPVSLEAYVDKKQWKKQIKT